MPILKVMSIQLIKLRIINSSEFKCKKTGHYAATCLDTIIGFTRIFCKECLRWIY